MPEEQFYARNIEVQTILSHTQKFKQAKKSVISAIIHVTDKEHNRLLGKKIIGGDTEQDVSLTPPTIIIEKTTDDQISKIVVTCPCGRHAELICEYEN